MLAPTTLLGDHCQYCGSPIARSFLVFSHRRNTEQVSSEVSLCGTCASRVEYYLRIALPDRLLRTRAAMA